LEPFGQSPAPRVRLACGCGNGVVPVVARRSARERADASRIAARARRLVWVPVRLDGLLLFPLDAAWKQVTGRFR
jgi:hypothetical protein